MDLELTILNSLREKEFFNKVAPYIHENMLSEKGRVVFSSLQELMKGCPEEGKITLDEIRKYLDVDSTLSKADKIEYKKYRKQIRRSKVKNEGVLLEICKEFLEKNIWKDALEKFMPFLNKRGLIPLDPIEEALDENRKIRESFGEIKGYDFFENISRSQVTESPGAVQSIIKGLSLYPGEVGIIGGGPKKGKTCALVNIGYSALVQGKKVLHFTLEIPADWLALRYDGRIIEKPYKEIRPEDSARAVKKIKMLGGTLIIEDRAELSLLEIRNYLTLKKFDLVIVDYADLLTSPSKSKEKRHQLLSIFQGLRRIAKEFKIPIWTASQLTAKSFSKKIADLEDLEESKIGKAGTASLVLTLNQTPEEKEDGMMRIFIAACTRGIKGKALRKFDCNLDTMTLKELIPKKERE
jgi:hypothetical protein